jgi:hypothetical protein
MDSDDDFDYYSRPTSKVILVPTSNLCSHERGKSRKGAFVVSCRAADT